jgi:predicted dehydrogenase
MRWRYDPAQAGISGQFADCGIHALHMASFVTGQNARSLSADFVSAIESRTLEDDAMVNVRMDGGATVRLWTSSVAVGSFHGFNIRVFGEKGGLRWAQQWPDQMQWTPLNGRTETIERGMANLSPDAERATRIATGHSEGMLVAFANIYADLADQIERRRAGALPDPAASHVPTAVDGLRSIAAIKACVSSAQAGGAWVDARPPGLRAPTASP